MKCPNCGNELKNVTRNLKIVVLNDEDIEFLRESNAIEREYSDMALDDAMEAFRFAYANKNQFTVEYILEIHKLLMIRLNKRIAGKIRKVDVWVGSRKCLDPKEIKVHLEAWLEHAFTKKDEEGIRHSHIAFEKIHPFEDGNGRTGRILMNIQRINAGLPIMIIHEGKEQMSYYRWFL